jgi:hypothetical protein
MGALMTIAGYIPPCIGYRMKAIRLTNYSKVAG